MTIKPGVGVHGEVTNPPALATGVVQNPFTPVEYGRTAAKSKYTVVNDDDSLPDYGTGSSGDSGAISGVTIAGGTTASDGGTEIYAANVAGTDVNTSKGTFAWVVTGGSATVAASTASSTSITFNEAASFTVACTYTEVGVTGSPKTGNKTVTVS